MGFMWFCYRWYRRLEILSILVRRYFNPWDSFYLHPIVFDIWALAMNADAIADHVVDLEAAQEANGGGDAETLMDDESIDHELLEVLNGARRAGVETAANGAGAGHVDHSSGAGVSFAV